MSIISWLTGRDEKESDVYANYDKVDSVVSNIKAISSNEVENANAAIKEAINQINNVNGIAEYVGTVNDTAFDEVFESVATSIEQVGELLQSKANDIKEYEESAWYEKLGSTFAMTGAKLGEGILSVAEDLGDGVVSILGGFALGGIQTALTGSTSIKDGVSSFVEKDLSHDAFNFYYNSDFAKKSVFTEDSAAAGAIKVVGNTAGYLALGGALSGVAKGAGLASKAAKGGNALKAANLLIGTSTRANTTLAVVTGIGSSTESGLQNGESFDDAFKQGVKQGAIQGVTAYAMGKIGEKAMKNKAITEQKEIAESADEVLKANENMKTARKAYQEAILNDADKTTKATLKAEYESATEALKAVNNGTTGVRVAELTEARDAAQAELKTLNGQKLSSFNGYHDSISNTFREKGEQLATDGVKTTVKNAKQTFVEGVQNRLSSGIEYNTAEGTAKLTYSAGSITKGVAETVKDIAVAPVKAVASTTKAVVTAGAENAANMSTTVGKVAVGALETGVGVASLAKGISENSAETQFRTNAVDIKTPTKDEIDIETPTGDTSGIDTNPSGDQDNGNGGNGNGNGNGGNSGGGGGTPSGNDSTQQFRKSNDNSNNDTNTTDKDTTTNNGDTTNNDADETFNNEDTTDTDQKTTTETTPTETTGEEKPTETITTPTTTETTPTETTTQTTTNTETTSTTGTTQHTGGGYSGTSGYTSSTTEGGLVEEGSDASVLETATEETTSIDNVIKGSKYTKVPSSSSAISTTSSSSGSSGSTVIPIAAGLSAAAAAGIGAKAYMDRKNNNDNGEDDDLDTETWSGDENIEIDYDESSDKEQYLDDDDYSYEESTEKYGARNNEELADLQ